MLLPFHGGLPEQRAPTILPRKSIKKLKTPVVDPEPLQPPSLVETTLARLQSRLTELPADIAYGLLRDLGKQVVWITLAALFAIAAAQWQYNVFGWNEKPPERRDTLRGWEPIEPTKRRPGDR